MAAAPARTKADSKATRLASHWKSETGRTDRSEPRPPGSRVTADDDGTSPVTTPGNPPPAEFSRVCTAEGRPSRDRRISSRPLRSAINIVCGLSPPRGRSKRFRHSGGTSSTERNTRVSWSTDTNTVELLTVMRSVAMLPYKLRLHGTRLPDGRAGRMV